MDVTRAIQVAVAHADLIISHVPDVLMVLMRTTVPVIIGVCIGRMLSKCR